MILPAGLGVRFHTGSAVEPVLHKVYNLGELAAGVRAIRSDVVCSQPEAVHGWDRRQVGGADEQLQQRLDAVVPVQDPMDGIRVVIGLGMESFTNVVLVMSCQPEAHEGGPLLGDQRRYLPDNG